MKINGLAKFNLFDVYPFKVNYTATVDCGEIIDIEETGFEEMGLDVYDDSRTEFAYMNAFHRAVEEDVEEILKKMNGDYAAESHPSA